MIIFDQTGWAEMAWIKINDTIDGPKLRELYKRLGVSKFEATGILVFLWQWGLQNADEQGHIISADREDVERYLHGASAGCSVAEGDIFNALLETGWIDEENGELYLHDWGTWQKEWYKYRDKLKRDAERKRRAAKEMQASDGKAEEIPVEDEAEIPVEIPAEKPAKAEKKPKKAVRDYTEEFNAFWEIYPRRDRKAEAFECFNARLGNGVSPEDMIQAARGYAEKVRKERTPDRFIMQAKTFLGVHLNFMDYVRKPAAKVKPEGNPFDSYMEG